MVSTLAQDFAAEVAELCAIEVSGSQWRSFLDSHVPRVDPETSRLLNGRALTLADAKRDTLDTPYRSDPRIAPWAGTAQWVLQAINTYEHHAGTIRGVSRAERNGLKTINGDFDRLDRTTWTSLRTVLDSSSALAS